MYKEYWKLDKSPFDNVPDPEMYFRLHSTVESTVAELLFAIEEGNECLAVVVGEVGLGKTMALRVTLDTLDPEKYRIAFVTNPDLTFPQLLREIIGQLNGEPCAIRRKELLLEEFNRILFDSADQDKKVLVFIDEGNVLTGPNLESLRLLTNMQEDKRNLFTIILAGQPKLGKKLRDKRRANLLQRVGVLCRLEPLDSVELTRDYVEHRLERAGCDRTIFTDAAYTKIFEFSGGVPRLINKICKLCLKAGETNELEQINADVVFQVALRFEWEWPRCRAKTERKESRAAETEAEPELAKVAVEGKVADHQEPHVPREPHVQQEPSAGPEKATEAAPESPGELVHLYEELDLDDRDFYPSGELEPVHAATASKPAEESASATPAPASQPGPAPGEPPLDISAEVLAQLNQVTDQRKREQIAGRVAADELHRHPEHYATVKDPVERWRQLRHEILARLSP